MAPALIWSASWLSFPVTNCLRSFPHVVAWISCLDRYFHAYGTFVLVVSGSLEANGMKKLIEIVYNLLVEAIQLCSFVVGNFGVSPVRLQ